MEKFRNVTKAMPVDGYRGPGPYILRAAGWVAIGFGFFYMFQDRGTRMMKDKYEEEGRSLTKERENIKLMMERLRDSPSNLTQVREQTTKERRKWAGEVEQQAQDKSDK